MAQGTRICKICGKEYPYCFTVRRGDIFRWQDVACCAEHGSEYFAQVLAAREPNLPKIFPPPPADDAQDNSTYVDEDMEDELFEEEFDDDEDMAVVV